MNILVISLAGIGDALLATPMMRVLREARPNARIDAAVFWPGARELLEGNPNLDHVHAHNFLADGAAAHLRWLRDMRRRRYDLSINTFPQSRRAYRVVAALIGARLRLSHRYDRSGPADALLVNRRAKPDYNASCVENNLNLLRLLDIPIPDPPPHCELFPSPADRRWARERAGRLGLEGRTALGLHSGTGRTKNLALRRWPAGHYVELIRALRAGRPGLRIVLFNGPDEEEDTRRILRDAADSGVAAAGNRTLLQAAALLESCSVFLSVDNLFMHLAAAMKVPEQIVIDTPSFNRTMMPWRRPVRVVPNPMVAGRHLEFYRYDGKGLRGDPERLRECMASISPDAVREAVEQALSRFPPDGRAG